MCSHPGGPKTGLALRGRHDTREVLKHPDGAGAGGCEQGEVDSRTRRVAELDSNAGPGQAGGQEDSAGAGRGEAGVEREEQAGEWPTWREPGTGRR